MYSDEELSVLLQKPDTQRKAFEYIVGQYSEQLYWMVRRMVLDHDDANDVLQNTFLKAWNGLVSFQGQSKVTTWLSRIAINESIDFLRRQKNHGAVSTDEDMSIANNLMADTYFDGDETQALLQQAIATLPDVQRTVFQLRYFEDKKYSEISRLLNTSEGSLKASYHIAVKKISEFFKAYD